MRTRDVSEDIALNTLRPLSLNEQGAIVVQQLGAPAPLPSIDTADLVDVDLLLEVANRLVRQVPAPQRRSATG